MCLGFVCVDWWLVWCLLDVGGFDLCALRCVAGLICILGLICAYDSCCTLGGFAGDGCRWILLWSADGGCFCGVLIVCLFVDYGVIADGCYDLRLSW